MTRKSIGIDLDDTLNELLNKWLYDYNQKYSDNLKRDDVIDWDWTKFVKPECGKDIYKFLHTQIGRAHV
jgi:5'(3')-deoxyribonucleotidase